MIPYWKIVIAIIGLLVVQAWCDLSLPSYTSDIIDVGIQNHGVEHVMPGEDSGRGISNCAVYYDGSGKAHLE